MAVPIKALKLTQLQELAMTVAMKLFTRTKEPVGIGAQINQLNNQQLTLGQALAQAQQERLDMME